MSQTQNSLGSPAVVAGTRASSSNRYRIHVIDLATQILDCFGFEHQELSAQIDPEESYRLQLRVIEMKQADGAKVVGKKIGLTSKAMQTMLNVDQPDYGHIRPSGTV
jgi:2-keto-4-pentenoate hydratase